MWYLPNIGKKENLPFEEVLIKKFLEYAEMDKSKGKSSPAC